MYTKFISMSWVVRLSVAIDPDTYQWMFDLLHRGHQASHVRC